MTMNRKRRPKTLLAFLSALLLATGGHPVEAGDPIGDFFKRLGNSIAHPQRAKSPKRPAKTRAAKPRTSKGPETKEEAVSSQPSVPPDEAVAAPTATPVPVRIASSAPQTKGRRRDVPYGVPVANRPGFVTSPYAPTLGVVDVRGFPSGTEVTDPYTDKVFLAP